MRQLACLLALILPAAAHALPGPLPTIYAGVQGGLGAREGDGGRHDGVDFGGFAGAELPAGLFYLAGEADIGGATGHVHTTADLGDGVVAVHAHPQWNWDATARAGLAPVPGLAVYALAGYGGERLHLTADDGSDHDSGWARGVVYGAGARYHFGQTGVRLEWRERQTGGRWDPHQLLGGVFVRF